MLQSTLRRLPRNLLILLLPALILPGYLFAQTQISGFILNEAGEGQFFAHVLILNAQDSSVIMGTIAEEDGSYKIDYPLSDDFIISAKMLGFLDAYSGIYQVDVQTDSQNIPAIILYENSTQLDEVQIVEQRALFEQKNDRMVVNIDSRISSAGSNALDILKRSPGLMVNPQTSTITMNGKGGVVVMINEKITRMSMEAVVQMLASMSADNIERIELIHTPPANFDAQANAGYINIVLKKRDDLGLNGGYNVNAGYGKGAKAGAGIDMNYRKKKINLYGNYSYDYNSWPQNFINYRAFERDGVFIENSASSDREPTRTDTHIARIGIDIHASDKTVIGGLVSFFDRHWTMEAVNDVRNLEDGVLVDRINIPNDEVNDRRRYLSNFNISHKLNDKQSINLDLDYLNIYSSNPSNYTNEFYDASDNLIDKTSLRVSKETPMDILVGKLDYHNIIDDNWSFDLGIKGTSIAFENDILVEEQIQDEWNKLPLFSSVASLDEKIASAYSIVSFKKSKTEVKAGLRYEYTDTNLGTVEEMNIVDRQFGKFFPSVFISNQISDNHSVQLSYRRGIRRPSFWDLAPFFIFWDPSTVLTGNPTLLSSINDDIRFSFNVKTVQFSTQYTFTHDPIARWQPQVDQIANTQVNGAKNFDESHLFNATVSFPVKLNDWMEVRTSWSALWSEIIDLENGVETTFTQNSWYMNGSMNFNLSDSYSMELSGNYFSPTLGGAVVWSSFSTIDFGIQKEFASGAKLSFNISDILLGGNFRGKLDDPNIDFEYRGEYNMAERIFKLSFSDRFGNTKLKNARKRNTGATEELQRTN